MYEGNNGLEGGIPKELASISGLKYMSLGKHIEASVMLNAVDFVNFWICIFSPLSCYDLMRLYFVLMIETTDNLNLTGTIPTEFGNLTSLQYLGLGKMTFVKSI